VETIHMHASDDDLLTVQDVAEILRVPTSWVYERTSRLLKNSKSL
jgi:hypothetical protein